MPDALDIGEMLDGHGSVEPAEICYLLFLIMTALAGYLIGRPIFLLAGVEGIITIWRFVSLSLIEYSATPLETDDFCEKF
jgi:hypothetical protein